MQHVRRCSHHGHTVSYDEVRQFETSVPESVISQHTEVFIPWGVRDVGTDDVNTYVDGTMDNFDKGPKHVPRSGKSSICHVCLLG